MLYLETSPDVAKSFAEEHWQCLQNNPSPSLQLIQQTCDRGAVYLASKTPVAFDIASDLALSANQHALKSALLTTP